MSARWRTDDNRPEEFFGAGFHVVRETRDRVARREARTNLLVRLGRCLLVDRLSLRGAAIRCGVSRSMARSLLVRLAPDEYERRTMEWLATRASGRKREASPLQREFYNRNRRRKYAADADYREQVLARNRGKKRPARRKAAA